MKSQRLMVWSVMFWMGAVGATAHADYLAGAQTFSFHIAGSSGDRRDQMSSAVKDNDDAALRGGSLGAQYIYFFRSAPTLGLGLDINLQKLRAHTDDLLVGDRVGNHFRLQTYQAVLKLAFPTGRFRPYVFGGLGVAHSHASLTALPAGDTAEADRVTLAEGSRTSVAVSDGVGMEFFLTSKIFVGLEARQMQIGRHRYDATSVGQSLGVSYHSPSTVNSLLLRFGFQWH